MSITLKFDEASYRHALNRFVYDLKADGVLLLKEEMRLLLRDIVRFTPPKTQAQGRRAITGDVARAVNVLDQSSFGRAKQDYRERMRALIAKRDNETIQKILRNSDSRPWIVKRFDPTDHTGARNAYGRVRRKTFVATTDAREYKRYLANVLSRVGFARAGWMTAANAVGLSMPSWVSRHAGKAQSGYTAPTPDSLVIEARNRSSKIPNYFDRHVYPAVRSRITSIQSELRRLLDGGKSRRGSLANTPSGQPN